MADDPDRLPPWVTWEQRPFPDANMLLLPGRNPALVDSGFVAHAGQTADWVHARTSQLSLVVNTHWHADHVGGNAILQARGAGIAVSVPDADAVARRDPGCCQAEYLDQPVAPYTVDEPLRDGQIIPLGDAEWQVIRTPGHTPGHLCLWQPDERLLITGDALSDYDVGWVNTALDGPDAAATVLRLRPDDPRRHPHRTDRALPAPARLAHRRRAATRPGSRCTRRRTGRVDAAQRFHRRSARPPPRRCQARTRPARLAPRTIPTRLARTVDAASLEPRQPRLAAPKTATGTTMSNSSGAGTAVDAGEPARARCVADLGAAKPHPTS